MKNIMAKERILITSALPYIHGKPHLGNLVGSLLPADVYYRFTKLFGQKSIYICGSDSHGTMFEIAAKKAGISTRDFVYRSHEEVKEVLEKFEIKPTFYGITDSENTKKLTYEIFEKLDKNGYIFEQENEMFYCEDCRLYLADRWVEGECAHCGGLARGDQCDDCGQVVEIKEILNPTCIHCGGKSVIRKKLKDLYLDLPKIWKDKNLDAWLDTNNMDSFPLAITKGYLNTGLKPRPISRAGTNWGFPIPKKGFEDKVFYVWFDAPIGYIGITKDWCEKSNEKLDDWWKNESVKYVQFMGKDNIFFHTTFFLCMLCGANDNYHLVDKLKGYAYLLGGETKFSKSRGNGLSSEEALNLFPADYWRFYLTYKQPEKNDTTFSWEDFQRVINKELIDNFGNLVCRVQSLIKSKGVDNLPEVKIEDSKLYKKIQKNLNNELLLSVVLKDILRKSKCANKFMQNKAPWKNDDYERVLCELHKRVGVISELLSPIIPKSIKKLKSHTKTGNITPLFEKISDEKIKELVEKYGTKNNESKKHDKFLKLDLKIGEIISVEDNPNADKLLVMQVDFGSEKRQIVGGIKGKYTQKELIGKKAVFLTNLKPRTIKGFESQGMILVAEKRDSPDAQNWSILIAENSEAGAKVFVEDGAPNPPKEIEFSDFEAINLITNEKGEILHMGKSLQTKDENTKMNIKIKTDRKVDPGAQIY